MPEMGEIFEIKKLISLQEVQSSVGEAVRQIIKYIHHIFFF